MFILSYTFQAYYFNINFNIAHKSVTQSVSDDIPGSLRLTADFLLILLILFFHVLQFYKSLPGIFLSIIMAVFSVPFKSSTYFAHPFSVKWQIYNILNVTDCQSYFLGIERTQKRTEYTIANYM